MSRKLSSSDSAIAERCVPYGNDDGGIPPEIERESALESLADASAKLHCSTRQQQYDACLKWCREAGCNDADINEAIEAGKSTAWME